eukprot:g4147.t1
MQDEATGTERARATRQSLQEVWPEIQRLGQDVPNLDDDLWNSLDDDGNGFINFSEFAEFTTKKKVNLPLGLDDLMKNSTAAASLKCGVFDCQCSEFQGRRPRCRRRITCPVFLIRDLASASPTTRRALLATAAEAPALCRRVAASAHRHAAQVQQVHDPRVHDCDDCLNVEAGRLSIVPFRGSNDWTTLGLLINSANRWRYLQFVGLSIHAVYTVAHAFEPDPALFAFTSKLWGGLTFLISVMCMDSKDHVMQSEIKARIDSTDASSLKHGFRQVLRGVCDGDLLLDRRNCTIERLLKSSRKLSDTNFLDLFLDAESRENFLQFLAGADDSKTTMPRGLREPRARTRTRSSVSEVVEAYDELVEISLLVSNCTGLLDIEEAHLRFDRGSSAQRTIETGMPTLRRFIRPTDWDRIEGMLNFVMQLEPSPEPCAFFH